MGNGREKLSAAKVASHTRLGYLLDGGGLYLQVAKRAPQKPGEIPRKPVEEVSKSWTFRYRDRNTGKLRELGLGALVDVPLARARAKAAALRALLQEGKDPFEERRQARLSGQGSTALSLTFDDCVSLFMPIKRAELRNVKSGDQWENTLRAYVTPHFGSLPIAQVDTPMVVKALSVIWTEKNETACRLRQRIEAILDWATVSGYRKGDNPARWNGHLEHVLPKPTKKTEHHAALPYSEMNAFMTALHEQKGVAALALEFTILTAARTGEVIGARWDEIDMDLMTWTIPAERMKAAKEHTVPLSQRALKILKDLDKEKKGPYVFPGGNEDAPLSNMAMAALLKRMELTEITVHGFRSTFRDWAGEQTNFPREVVEHALAHQLKDKAEAAYSRSTLPEKRRKLMEAWAQYALTKSPVAANIVAIRSA